MQHADDIDRRAIEEARAANAARRTALLELSPSERLKLAAELCLVGGVLPPPAERLTICSSSSISSGASNGTASATS